MPQYTETMIGRSGTPTGLIINPLHQKLYAKAIYDNIAESTDELAFKRGDILAIIEQDTDGLEGWWLCSLRGRQGICPGNRLKLIHNSYDSGCYSPSPISSPSPSIISTPTSSIYHSSNSFTQSDLYENSGFIQQQLQQQKHGKRRSWHIMTNKVITPQKCGDVYLYDLLPQSNRTSPYQNLSTMSDPDAYDIPKPAVHINYDTSSASSSSSSSHRSSITSQLRSSGGGGDPQQQQQQLQQQQQQQLQQQQQKRLISTPTIPDDSYDIPRPSTLLSQQNLTPSSSNSSLLTSDSLSLSSSNRSSLINMPDYDIPKRNPKAIIENNRCTTPSQTNAAQTPNSMMMTYDIPQQQQQQQQQKQYSQQKQLGKKELPLKLSSALESLAKLQDEATSAVTRLLAFVTPSWREKDKLDPILMDVKLAAVRLRTALHDLAEFGEGALGNAGRADDKSLALKLRPLVKALRDADKLIHEASLNLDHYGWTVEVLARPEQPHKLQSLQIPPDCLDQLIACAQTLTEDVRQIASFIQGNATLLFNRTITTTPTPTSSTTTTPTSALAKCSINDDCTEDYEYVQLKLYRNTNNNNNNNSNHNNVNQLRTNADLLPENLQKKFDNKLKSSSHENTNENTNNNNNNNIMTLTPHDKSLLIYYTTQTVTHMGYLTQAIDAFLQTVERNQPPKFFLAYGKFVVLSAHNIVYIGDIVSRNVSCKNIQLRLMHCADMLSDALKTCVAKTKNAAQLFPSVTAVQEMVDSVVDISHLAYELKVALLQTNIIR